MMTYSFVPEATSNADFQTEAFQKFKDLGFPTQANEDYKYLPLEELLGRNYKAVSSDSFSPTPVPESATVHGHAKAGRWEWNLAQAKTERTRLAEAFAPKSSFDALSVALCPDPQTLHFSQSLSEPVYLRVDHGQGSEAVSAPNLHVQLDPGVSVTLVITQVGGSSESAGFDLSRWTYDIADNANLEVLVISQQANTQHRLSQHRLRLGEKSNADFCSLALSGGIQYTDIEVLSEKEESTVGLRGLSLVTDSHIAIHRTYVELTVPNLNSAQLFKNILFDASRAEYSGTVHVHPNAMPVESDQMNRNLLLGTKARAYSRPQLRIFADDVVCTHGSSTSALSQDEEFYLESRGIEKQVAQQLLIRGFAEEGIVDEIQHEELAALAKGLIQQRLSEINYGC